MFLSWFVVCSRKFTVGVKYIATLYVNIDILISAMRFSIIHTAEKPGWIPTKISILAEDIWLGYLQLLN